MVKRFNVMFFALICFLILPLHGLAGVLVDQPLSIVAFSAYTIRTTNNGSVALNRTSEDSR